METIRSTGDGARRADGRPDRTPDAPSTRAPAAVGEPRVTLVHDYLTQRGGAERVVLEMMAAFPGAPVHTSLYEPDATYPEFARGDIRVSPLNRAALVRRRHRLALPLLAPVFSGMAVDSDVTVCSSSGWAHGVRTTGRKVVYCYTPARWLYQGDAYLGTRATVASRVGLGALSPGLRRWDRRAAASAHRYVTTSSEVRRRIQHHYGRDAEVLPPPPAMRAGDPRQPFEGVGEGYWLCVSRLLPYKNVDAVLAAFAALPGERLVVVGSGPEEPSLRAAAGPNVTVVGHVGDAQLRWLYANCRGLVAASFEDYGLTPLEASVFGKPSVVLRWGGFLDTVVDGLNGTFFAAPDPAGIAEALRRAAATEWSAESIEGHAGTFNSECFARRLREIVGEEAGLRGAAP